MFCILDITENSSCYRIYGTEYRQGYIQFRIEIGKGKNVLFEIVISSMPAECYERVVCSKYEQLVFVPRYNFLSVHSTALLQYYIRSPSG